MIASWMTAWVQVRNAVYGGNDAETRGINYT